MSQKNYLNYTIIRLNENDDWKNNDSNPKYVFDGGITYLGEIDSLSSLDFVDKALNKITPDSTKVYKLKSKTGKFGYYMKISDIYIPVKFVKRSTKKSVKRSTKRSVKKSVKRSTKKSAKSKRSAKRNAKRKSSKRSQ